MRSPESKRSLERSVSSLIRIDCRITNGVQWGYDRRGLAAASGQRAVPEAGWLMGDERGFWSCVRQIGTSISIQTTRTLVNLVIELRGKSAARQSVLNLGAEQIGEHITLNVGPTLVHALPNEIRSRVHGRPHPRQ